MRIITITTMNPYVPILRRPSQAVVHILAYVLAALLGAGFSVATFAQDVSISLKIRDHHFLPAEVEIPAGVKCVLNIDNEDPTAEEFESHSLHREKIIPAKSRTTLFIGPVKPGRYEFFGEFNDATARGVVVAR
jgi:hypothetical protein